MRLKKSSKKFEMDIHSDYNFFHCSKCHQHINELTSNGRYLKRISPIGEDFIGVCAPGCNYSRMRATGSSSLEKCLEDNIDGT